MPADDPAAGAGGSRLYVVSGPGGVGKGTLVSALARRRPDVVVSVSATTRPPRPGEGDGVAYHFLDDAAFDALVAEDGFLEWARFGGFRYGTPWSSVEAPLRDGRRVLLEIDVQGALQVRRRFADAVLVFVRPPHPDALEQRLRRRGTDSPERIAQRIALAADELAQARAFDHEIVNDDLGAAVPALSRILDR
ncbi:MAG: guanylate kinase [Actinomycetota bacterium]|nr:guanylate kinase [Actinomycetota bacterium]